MVHYLPDMNAMKFFVIKIHNNSLGRIIETECFEDAFAIIEELFHNQFNLKLNEEQKESLTNNYELYFDQDHDNTHLFAIGTAEYWKNALPSN